MAEDTAERWNKLQGWFEEAMALEEKDRDAFVASLLIDEELRQELANVPPGNREQVVRAMIENYKAKASILERVLERLEESKPNQENSKQRYETEKI